ncbi:MAG: hypothetical protein M1833_000690 [Piccolia ochrophora]|nr:MAG: hypothetical protein M1833_000690 [Piccolia ochrophora]
MAALFHRKTIPLELLDLSDEDVSLLTQPLSIPSCPPPERNSTHGINLAYSRLSSLAAYQIRGLPSHLRAPVPQQTRIVSFFTRHLPASSIHPASPLCAVHKPLNAQLLQSILATLRIEVSTRLNNLAAAWPDLSPEHQCFVQSLRALNAMWTSEADLRHSFSVKPSDTWCEQRDRCAGCMLARVGAKRAVCVDLLVALHSRVKQGGKRPAPRLIRWVRGWLNWNGGVGEGLDRDVQARARNLKRARRRAREVAREARAGKMEGAGEVSEGEGEGEDDVQGDLLWRHTDARPPPGRDDEWPRMLSDAHSEVEAHTRYVDSFPAPLQPGRPSSSVYEPPRTGWARLSVQDQATAYQDLLRELEPRPQSASAGGHDAGSRLTQWTDFLVPE